MASSRSARCTALDCTLSYSRRVRTIGPIAPTLRAQPSARRFTRKAPQAQVGVLLVHGIGDHAEGETLVAFGEPLIDWIREWMAGPAAGPRRGEVRVIEARLRALRTEAESPAYSWVELEQADAAAHRERWLFAEAWWGGTVQAPRSLPLLAWMFSRVPLLVMWHMFGGERRDPVSGLFRGKLAVLAPIEVKALKWAAMAAKVVSAPLLIIAMQAVILLALVLWLIPIGPWRRALLAIVRTLTLTLGDSYVLLEQDIQRAALVDRVRRSLAWLSERVQRVVVIAHSQGAAIAHEALRGSAPVEALITVGSGLEKLEFLRAVRLRGDGVLASMAAAPLLLAGAALFVGVDGTGLEFWAAALFPGVLLVAAFVCVWRLSAALDVYRTDVRDALAPALADLRLSVKHWWDFHATLDLVPMGAGSMLGTGDFPQRCEIRNECSLISDHVRYFETWCGFGVMCWQVLAQMSRLELLRKADTVALQGLARAHGWRAFALGLGTLFSPLTLLPAGLLFAEPMIDLGKSIIAATKGVKVPYASALLEGAARHSTRAVTGIFGLGNSAAELLSREQLIVALVSVLLALALWWAVALAVWRALGFWHWRAGARGRSLSMRDGALGKGVAVFVAFIWALAAMAPLLVALIVAQSSGPMTLVGVGRVCAYVLTMLLALAVTFGGVLAGWVIVDPAARQASGEVPRLLMPAALGFGVWVWSLPADWMWSVATAMPFEGRIGAFALTVSALSCAYALTRARPGLVWLLALMWTVPLTVVVLAAFLSPWGLRETAVVFAVVLLAIAGLVRSRLP